MDVVVKDLLPSRRAVGLGDIQASQVEPFAKQERNSVDGAHDGSSLVLRKCPDIFGMSSREYEGMATGDLGDVQERNAVLILVHLP